jgi:hypothetical protein
MKTPANDGEYRFQDMEETGSGKGLAAFRPDRAARLDALQQETYHPYRFSQGFHDAC